MGFFRTTWRVVQCVASLGGTECIRSQQERHAELIREYEVIRSRIGEQYTTLIAEIREVKKRVRIARRSLKRAARLLRQFNPEVGRTKEPTSGSDLLFKSQALAGRMGSRTTIDGDLAILAGAAAGTAIAASSWGWFKS
jgi:hypothetical protein